jgi:hypothetical protein
MICGKFLSSQTNETPTISASEEACKNSQTKMGDISHLKTIDCTDGGCTKFM